MIKAISRIEYGCYLEDEDYKTEKVNTTSFTLMSDGTKDILINEDDKKFFLIEDVVNFADALKEFNTPDSLEYSKRICN